MKNFSFTLIILVLLSSCAIEKNSTSGWDYNSPSTNQYSDEHKTSKKVIYTSTLYMTVTNPDSARARIAVISSKYEGYLKESGTSVTIIRVPSKYLDSTTSAISLLGRVDNKYSTGKDVTEDYSDFQIRLDNAVKARSRYLELLEKAENVEAALKVEKELERLNETIELLKGKMNRMDHLVSYSTVSIYLKEKKKPGLIGYVGIGLYASAKWLFVRN